MIIIMGLLDSIKKIQGMAEQAKNIAAQLKDAAGALNSNSEYEATPVPIEEDSEPEVLAPDSSGQIVINSVNQMASWLNSLPAKNTTAVALKVMESQMQVIQFVRTPSLLGMVLDNMIATLYQTLKQTTSAQEKETTREIMSAMIQNLIFFADAQLHYMIDQNKQEAKRLLSQAGDMLAKSVANVAVFTAGPTAVAGVVLKNVFDSEEVQNGFFGKLIGWITDKKQIAEKKKDFDKTLQNMFETFDKYAALIGTSIQIHGMLGRYKEQVLCNYGLEKYDSLFSQFSQEFSAMKYNSRLEPLLAPLGISMDRSGDWDYMIKKKKDNDNIIGAFDELIGISKLVKSFSDNTQYKEKFNYEYLLQISAPFKKSGNSSDTKIYSKLEYYLVNAKPICDDIQAYATRLTQTVDKYAFGFEEKTTDKTAESDAARQMFDKMFAMALSDGVITEEEIEILRPYAVSAGISEGEFKLMVLNKTNFK